jgi:hypothetical protein
MKLIGKYLLLAGLLAGAGCTRDEIRPDSVKKTSTLKTADDDVPTPVSKLLPADQLNDKNANAQAQAMYDALKKEKNQIERTESAKND